MSAEERVRQSVSELQTEELSEKVRMCYQCGTCTGGCPVAKVDARYNPRRIMEGLGMGDGLELVRSEVIWLCANCHACLERCPQKIEVSHLLTELRNLAVRVGNVPEGPVGELKQVAASGRTSPVSSAVDRRRAELGLPPIAPAVGTDDIQKIIEITGLGDLEKETISGEGGQNV